jgi:hypothetical protein
MNKIIPSNLQKQFGNDFIKILIKYLMANKKKSSGDLINSLSPKLQDTAAKIQIQIESMDYLNYVDKGRKKGSYAPIKSLLKWASMKGLSDGAAFAVQQKIFKFGIKPTNVINKAIFEFENGFENKYGSEIIKDIEEIITKELNKTNQ